MQDLDLVSASKPRVIFLKSIVYLLQVAGWSVVNVDLSH
jgi:hypothetical protein